MALAKSQRSLKAWSKQKWRTKSGKKSSVTGRTIFARESDKSIVICRVCGNDKSKTPRNKKGKQHVKQPKGIAKKTAKYRRYS